MKLAYTTDDAVTLAVEFDRWDAGEPNRAQWKWSIAAAETASAEDLASPTILAEGDDLRSGANGRADAVEALDALASFLGAWAEALDHDTDAASSGNADLFPATLADLGYDWQALAYDVTAALGTQAD